MSFLALVIAALFLQDPNAAPGHWPQWRGPNRDNCSTETGLLKDWPESGPPLLWSTPILGDGISPVSIAGGRIYGLGFRGAEEFVTSLDGNGNPVWSVSIGPHTGESSQMRFLSLRPITIDEDRLYAFRTAGEMICLQCLDGKILWRKSYSDFNPGVFTWYRSDAPVVDRDLLICKPGGRQAYLVALDKRTGKVVWQSPGSHDDPSNAPLMPAEIGGKKQYIVCGMNRLDGISAEDGRLLWSAPSNGKTAVTATPIYHDGIVLISCGFGVGCTAYRITVENQIFKAKELYSGKQLESHRGGILRVGDCLYGSNDHLQCVDFKTGIIQWQDRCVGKASLTYADGVLLVWGELNGTVALVDATPTGYHEHGRFATPQRAGEPAIHPVLAGGRLYLRDVLNLYCYDLRGPDYKTPAAVWKPTPNSARPLPKLPPGKPKINPAFVPTPHDVVKRMLEVANVGRKDVVYDLGSGDGRIVIAAADRYGCKAVGYEINPDLLQLSRQNAMNAEVDSLVSLEQADLFTVDLSPATVVTLYLGAENNARLLPQLRKLPPKCRIVSHQHRLGETGPEPDGQFVVASKEDPDPHVIYLWTTPLKEDK
jgi:outer membrane protein assembly factor BamB